MICNQCHKCNNCILRRLSSPPLLQSMAPSFEPEGTNVIRLHSVRSMQRRAAAASQKFCQSAPPTHVLTLEQETFFTRGAFAAGAMQREPASWMKTRQKTPFHISKECEVLFSISHIEVLFTLISNLEGRKEGRPNCDRRGRPAQPASQPPRAHRTPSRPLASPPRPPSSRRRARPRPPPKLCTRYFSLSNRASRRRRIIATANERRS